MQYMCLSVTTNSVFISDWKNTVQPQEVVKQCPETIPQSRKLGLDSDFHVSNPNRPQTKSKQKEQIMSGKFKNEGETVQIFLYIKSL